MKEKKVWMNLAARARFVQFMKVHELLTVKETYQTGQDRLCETSFRLGRKVLPVTNIAEENVGFIVI